MSLFQKYLEWLPERFEQAKREGKLDFKKEYPDWLKNAMKYGYVKNFRKMKDVTKFNSDYVGIVATTKDVYLFDRRNDYHEEMIITLMKDGIIPMKQEYLHYNSNKINTMPVICLEYNKHGNGIISLSTGYEDYVFGPKEVEKFMPIIKQMGAPFQRKQIWG